MMKMMNRMSGMKIPKSDKKILKSDKKILKMRSFRCYGT
jgi:hypothetical protein